MAYVVTMMLHCIIVGSTVVSAVGREVNVSHLRWFNSRFR